MIHNTNYRTELKTKIRKGMLNFWLVRILIWLPSIAAVTFLILSQWLQFNVGFIISITILVVSSVSYNVYRDWKTHQNIWKGQFREYLTRMRLYKLEAATADALSKMSRIRERKESNHSSQLGEISVSLAKFLQTHDAFKGYINERYLHDLKIAAPLHDIGRLALPDNLLHEEGDLNMGDFVKMKAHVLHGGDLLTELQKLLPWRAFFKLSKEICYHHHQQWDGNGYPRVVRGEEGREHFFLNENTGQPLKGEQIPLSARIVAVADVYLALTSNRPWRKGFSHEETIEMIRKDSGRKFDPRIVEAIVTNQSKLKKIISNLK